MGKSGSGKSTLSNLLMRFYQLQSGSIVIDGIAIQAIDIHWLRNNITVVPQNCVLFSDTIFRNIALGRRDYDRVTDAQVARCIHMAALDSTIAMLMHSIRSAYDISQGEAVILALRSFALLMHLALGGLLLGSGLGLPFSTLLR